MTDKVQQLQVTFSKLSTALQTASDAMRSLIVLCHKQSIKDYIEYNNKHNTPTKKQL